MLKNLTKNELTSDEQQKITEKIIEEGDIDNGKDGFNCFEEFCEILINYSNAEIILIKRN